MGKNQKAETKLGKVLFLGMGICNGHKAVISVGYTLPYTLKKAQQFERAANGLIKFEKIRVIATGQKHSSFSLAPDGITILEKKPKTENWYDGTY